MACIELRKIQQIKQCKTNHTSQLSTGMHLSRPKLLGNRRALDDLSFGDSSQSKTMYIKQYETYCFIGSTTASTIQIIFLLAMRIWHISHMFPRASQHSYGYHTGQAPPDLHQQGYVMFPYQATNHTVLLSELFSVKQWSSQAPHLVLSFLSFASSLPGHDNHLKTKNWHIGGISILKFKPCQIVSALQSEDCRCSFVEGVPCDHSSHPISKNYYHWKSLCPVASPIQIWALPSRNLFNKQFSLDSVEAFPPSYVMRCGCKMHTWFFNICTFFNHHIPTIFPNNCSWALPTAFFISHFKSIGPQFLSSWRHPIQTSLPKHKSIHWRFRYLCWIFANSLGSQIHEVVIAYMAQQKMLQSYIYIYIHKYNNK